MSNNISIKINGLVVYSQTCDDVEVLEVSFSNLTVTDQLSAPQQITVTERKAGARAGTRVEIDGDVESLSVEGNATIKGNVTGSVDAGGCVNCGDVSETVDAGGSVSCGNVKGDVTSVGFIIIHKKTEE